MLRQLAQGPVDESFEVLRGGFHGVNDRRLWVQSLAEGVVSRRECGRERRGLAECPSSPWRAKRGAWPQYPRTEDLRSGIIPMECADDQATGPAPAPTQAFLSSASMPLKNVSGAANSTSCLALPSFPVIALKLGKEAPAIPVTLEVVERKIGRDSLQPPPRCRAILQVHQSVRMPSEKRPGRCPPPAPHC